VSGAAWAMLAGGDGPGHMTLRLLALSLVLVLALPATFAILRTARAGREPDPAPGRRWLEAIWIAAPVLLLGALIALSVVA
jgi:heme/copper-type cytochrome/quinol oxidase subunit 2